MAYRGRPVPVLCDLCTLADMAHRLAKCQDVAGMRTSARQNDNWSQARLVTCFFLGSSKGWFLVGSSLVILPQEVHS